MTPHLVPLRDNNQRTVHCSALAAVPSNKRLLFCRMPLPCTYFRRKNKGHPVAATVAAIWWSLFGVSDWQGNRAVCS